MKIGIDVRCFSEGRKTGVEEYALNLLKHLFELDKKNKYVLFFNSFQKSFADFSWIEEYPNVSLKKLYYPNKLLNFFFWYLRWPKIDKIIGGVDVFFMPNINFAVFSGKTKLILTIHDLSFKHYPETFSPKRRLWHWFVNPRNLCRRSDKILAVSESTKNDLANYYKINLGKISVVYSGISENFKVINRNDSKLLAAKEKYKLPYKFILYLGTIEPRKNIIGIIHAYNCLRTLKNSELDKYKLVIAGERGWKNKKIFQEMKDSSFYGDIIFCGFIADKDKSYVCNLASLFVYPSFFEGFGFPPLEAMACGTPAIVSNNSSLPEAVDGAGAMIDVDRPEEICEAIKAVLLNKSLREKMREKGLARIKEFNWRKTAKEILEIIENLAEK